MGNFLADSSANNIITENQLSILLTHFDTNYIFGIITDNIGNRFNCYHIQMPNIIAAYEQDFKLLASQYTDVSMIETINVTRGETYKAIIDLLCNNFSLQFNEQLEGIDYYSAAYVLYSFLISDFKNNMINFFTNYIIREKNGLYDALGMASFKKSKDSSTVYNKKLYKNGKLAIINANLEYVLDSICNFDIPLDVLLNTTFTDKNYVKFIENMIQPIQDFFKFAYVPIIKEPGLRPILITDIRLKIQSLSVNDNIDLDTLQ